MSQPFLTKVFYFNAAHQYGHDSWSNEKNWDVFGPDSKIHGHNYTLEVMVTGSINHETGFIVDLGHLKKIVKKHVIDILDHSLFDKEV
ncbi:MAG: 6-carboxytetrahydropterin synthase, partial [Candidatus Neomarinimicrobiota bacterium]|nr:6-carboxytetrahydropterin synthase [Candidatus Neomarinimicrobiota bacterium]